MMKASKRMPPYLLLYAVGIIAISFSSIFVRWSEADVAVIAMYRLLLTNVLMLPFVWKYRQPLLKLDRSQWLLLMLSGAMLGLHFLLWMGSLRYTTVASSTVLLSLEPLLVMIASYFLFKAAINKAMVIGIGIAMIGSIMIGAGDFSLSDEALYGDLLSFLGAVVVAVHMLIGKHLLKRTQVFAYNFWAFFFAACLLAIYNVINRNPFTGYSTKEWGLFLLLAIVPTLLGHYVFNFLMKRMAAATVSMSVLGEPIFASLLALALLKEKITLYSMAAGMLMLYGVWVFIRYGKDNQLVKNS